MSKSSISLSGVTDPQSLALKLVDLAKSLQAGTVCLQQGAEYVTLKPAQRLEFELEAAIKKGRQKLSINVKWEDAPEAAAAPDFSITAVEPAAPELPEEAVPAEPAETVAEAPCEHVQDEVAAGALAIDEPKEKPAKKGKKK